MESASKLLIAFTFTAAVIPSSTVGAIAVDSITAEKVGIPAEDFVTPEEAKTIAVAYFNKYEDRDHPVGVSNTVILPWIIESWNEFKPDTFMAYYEITLYSGSRNFETAPQMDAIIRRYVNNYIGEANVKNNVLTLPYALLSREELNRELFGNSEVLTCWVPLNKASNMNIHSGFDVAIGFEFLVPYVGKEVLSKFYGFDTVDYERTIWFSFLDAFSIFKVDGGRQVYLQTCDDENIWRIFTNEAIFNDYFETNKSTINLDAINREGGWEPPNSRTQSRNTTNGLDELPNSDDHLKTYVPNLYQGTYGGEQRYCGEIAMANLIAFWCGGGYFDGLVPPHPGIELRFNPGAYLWPYRSYYKYTTFVSDIVVHLDNNHGIKPGKAYVKLAAQRLGTGFNSFIGHDIREFHDFPELNYNCVKCNPNQQYVDENGPPQAYPNLPAFYWDPTDDNHWEYIKIILAFGQEIVVGSVTYDFRGWPIWMNTVWGKTGSGWCRFHAYTVYGYDDSGHTVKCKTSIPTQPEIDLKLHSCAQEYGYDVMYTEFIFVRNSSYTIDPAAHHCIVSNKGGKKIFRWSLAPGVKMWVRIMNVVAVNGSENSVVVNEKPVRVKFKGDTYSLEYDAELLPEDARYNLEIVLRNGNKIEYPFEEGKR